MNRRPALSPAVKCLPLCSTRFSSVHIIQTEIRRPFPQNRPRNHEIGIPRLEAGLVAAIMSFVLTREKLRHILGLMIRRFILLLALLSVTGGIVSGTPLHSTNDKMMKCCKKAKSGDHSRQAQATRLCCGLNCSESSPTSVAASVNLAPASISVRESVASMIATLLDRPEFQPNVSLEQLRPKFAPTSTPKFVQHSSFLI